MYDRKRDYAVCGTDLTKYVPSLYRETKGATGSQSTHYCVLEEIFRDETFSPTDCLIDIGCGKGRVLAFPEALPFPGKLTGIELNEEVADIARAWSAPYENITVLAGDAFALDLTPYSVFFLGRPFEKAMFLEFLKKFENEIEKPVRVIYWVDQQSGHFLNNRPGWTMKKRAVIGNLPV